MLDSHCHLHDHEFFSEGQAENCLENAQKNGVLQIICIGTNHDDSLAAKNFAKNHQNVFWTYGVHPEFASKNSKNSPKYPNNIPNDGLADIKDQKLVAIGEIGLDYHYEGFDRLSQIKLFESELQLARDYHLPVSFHIREAFDDFFAVISNFPEIQGVVHSFTDNKKNLKKVLNCGFYVGVNGLATYSTLPLPPLERIILETDAPFLTPVPNRGKINEPAYIKDIAEWLSTKLGISSSEIAEKTTENGQKLFNLPNPTSKN